MGSCVTKQSVERISTENSSYKPSKKRTNNVVSPGKSQSPKDEKPIRSRSDSIHSNDSTGSEGSSTGSELSSPRVAPKDKFEQAKNKNVDMIDIFINGRPYRVPPRVTLYEACEFHLKEEDPDRIPPTFCFHPYLPSARLYQGKCGICEVEDAQTGELVRSCKTKVKKGMSILTWGKKVDNHIRGVLLEKLSSHPLNCPSCDDNGNCIFQNLLMKYDISPKDLDDTLKKKYLKACQSAMVNKKVIGNNSISFDKSKCLSCYRCIRVCEYVQGMSCQTLLKTAERNQKGVHLFRDIEDYHQNMYSTDCISCGQCSFVCPVGAISAIPHIKSVADLLGKRLADTRGNSNSIVVAQVAPSVRVTISEEFGLPPGKYTSKQLVSGLKKIGFDYVFDTNFAADLTVIEESEEFLHRLKNNGKFPMFTSCCPSWVNLAEKHFPEFIPNLSTCKSPQMMMGAIIKSYWAELKNIDRKNITVVSIMPCVAKKDEITRPQMKGDVDYVVTTRELGRFFKSKTINLDKLEDKNFDDVLGDGSGAAQIFGVTGGVTEAVLRTVYFKATGKDMPKLAYGPARGFKKYKKSTLEINKMKIRIGVIHTAKRIREFLNEQKELEMNSSFGGDYPQYALIEMMSCPGGCIGGGGNPKFVHNRNTLEERRMVMYDLDEKNKIRKSHNNQSIKKLYEEFLKKPLGEKSKKLLHTTYQDRCEIVENEKKNKMLLI